MPFIVTKVRQLTECLNTVLGSTGIANRLGGHDALDDGSDYSTGSDVLSGGCGKDLLIGGAGDDDILGDTDWVATSFGWTVTDEPLFRLFQPVTGVGRRGGDSIKGGDGHDLLQGGLGRGTINHSGLAKTGAANDAAQLEWRIAA